MRYNELKTTILEIFDDNGSMNFQELLDQIKKDLIIEQKAIQMALLRYHRQGLLNRRKKGKYYFYKISERGKTRLKWLRNNSKNYF
jgi:DNA-binding transcriptional regulator PaaX